MSAIDPQFELAICELVATALQVSPEYVTPTLAFGEISAWTSLGHMEILLRLESEWGVEITEETITGLISIPAICTYIQESNHTA